MRLEHDVKLTFDDVLIRPKRSTLVSRSDVNLNRDFRFRHTGQGWTGVPIVAANMDTTGTIAMGKSLSRHNMITCLSKHGHDPADWESITNEEIKSFDIAITLCGDAKDKCLNINSLVKEHFLWDIIDPAKATGTNEEKLNIYKSVRDLIENKIKDLDKLKFIDDEYNILKDQLDKNIKVDKKINKLFESLKKVNSKLEIARKCPLFLLMGYIMLVF